MNIKDIIEVEIIDIANTGDGVGKYNDIICFVGGTITGDKVKAKITKIKKNYINLDLIEIITPSKKRTKKICEISEKCGGCQIIEMNYNDQLELKQNIVFQDITRIGKIENPIVDKTIGMDKPYYYRNKTQIPLGIEKGRVVAGFYKIRTHDIIPFNNCYIQKEVNNKIIEIIKEFIIENNIRIYDEKTHTGNLRHIITRISETTSEIMVILVTKDEKKIKNCDILSKKLSEKIENFASLIQNVNPHNTNVVMGRKNLLLHGKDHIIEKIQNIEFEIYPNVFYQVNSKQMEKLYNLALEYSGVTKKDIVYDLYSGIGTISLLFAKKAKKVYGIEVVEDSVISAKNNAKRNNIDNAEFYKGKVEDLIEKLSKKETPDIVVLDPARKGAEKIVLDTITKASPKKIIYISCNPSTLARDLNIIRESQKYTIEKITPVDMFPHTMHVECIALIQRVKG